MKKELAFEASNKKYNSGKDSNGEYLSKAFKHDEMKKLSELLGCHTFTSSHGYGKAVLQGREIDFRAKRDEAVIEVSLGACWRDTRKRVKTLTHKQVANYKAKLLNHITIKGKVETINDELATIRRSLGFDIRKAQNGVNITCNGLEFRYNKGELTYSDSRFSGCLNLSPVATIKDLNEKVNEVKEYFKKFKNEVSQARKKIMSKIKDVEQYNTLSNKRDGLR